MEVTKPPVQFSTECHHRKKNTTHLLKGDWLSFFIWLRTVIEVPFTPQQTKKNLETSFSMRATKVFTEMILLLWISLLWLPPHRQPSNLQASSSLSTSVVSLLLRACMYFLAAHPQASSVECFMTASVCQDGPLSFDL